MYTMKLRAMLVTGMLICSIAATDQAAFAQFEEGKVGIGVTGGYTVPLREFNNWFDATYQIGGRMTVGVNPNQLFELHAQYGKFDTDQSRTGQDTYDGGSGEWNYNYNHTYQYIKASANYLYVPGFGDMNGSGNIYVMAGLSVARWEYERVAFEFAGYDFQTQGWVEQDMDYLNRNGYDMGLNLGVGAMINTGGNVSFDVRAVYEATVSSMWPFLLVGLEQADVVQFIGIHAGLHINVGQ